MTNREGSAKEEDAANGKGDGGADGGNDPTASATVGEHI